MVLLDVDPQILLSLIFEQVSSEPKDYDYNIRITIQNKTRRDPIPRRTSNIQQNLTTSPWFPVGEAVNTLQKKQRPISAKSKLQILQ